MSEPQALSYESTETKLSGVGIGTIALQLLGVYFIFFGVSILPMVMLALSQRFDTNELVLVSAEIAIYFGMGVAIIRLSPRISFWLFHGNPAGIMVGPVTSPLGQSLQAIAFSVLGVYMMATTLPQLAAEIIPWIHTPGSSPPTPIDLTPQIVSFLVGLVLFLQSKALSRLWHRLREGPAPLTNIHSDSDQA